MYRRRDRLWRELTLGSVIIQSVFFLHEGPVRWSIRGCGGAEPEFFARDSRELREKRDG